MRSLGDIEDLLKFSNDRFHHMDQYVHDCIQNVETFDKSEVVKYFIY